MKTTWQVALYEEQKVPIYVVYVTGWVTADANHFILIN